MSKSSSEVSRVSSEVRMPRTFSVKYELGIIPERMLRPGRGEVGKILRREDLYSSIISRWQQRAEGAFEALSKRKRGLMSDAVAAENRRLREENKRLKETLSTAEDLAVAQGKSFALLQERSRESANEK